MRIRRVVLALAVWAVMCRSANLADAAFHLWDIAEVFSSPDGTVQFVELWTPYTAEHLLRAIPLRSNSHEFTVPSNLPSLATQNRRVLFATAGFGLLPGGVTPNYTIPANFFDPAGDTLDWAFGSDVKSFTSLPTDGVHSQNFPGGVAINSPTNFAGATGSVTVVPEPALQFMLFAALASLVALSRKR